MEDFFKYIQFEKRYSHHTLISYQNDLSQFQSYLDLNYQLPVCQATHSIIRSWILVLGEEKLSSRTISRKIACLKSYFKFLVKAGKINIDPTQNIKSPKIRKRLPAVVSEKECLEMLEEIPFSEDFEGIRDRIILELLYGTGIRLSEIIEAKDGSIDLYNSIITVLGKGNKERMIPLNKNLITRIRWYMDKKQCEFGRNYDNYLIVTNTGEKTYPVFIYRTVKKYLSLVTTADKKSPHVLRHSFATHLLNKGADLNAIKDLLGHSSLAATQVYTHNTPEKLKAIFDQAHPKS